MPNTPRKMTNKEFLQSMDTEALAVFIATTVLNFLEPLIPSGASAKERSDIGDRIYAASRVWLENEYKSEEKKDDQI